MKIRFSALSLLLHISLVAVLIFKLSGIAEIPPQVVEFEIQKNKAVVKSGHGKKSGAKKQGPDQILFPQMSAYGMLGRVQQQSATAFADSRSYDTSIDEVFGKNGNRDWNYYREIYQKIDSQLVFDSLLAQYSHFGRVYVQFKVTEDGLFRLEDLKANARDSILKVHVLRAISRSLQAPLEKIKFSKVET